MKIQIQIPQLNDPEWLVQAYKNKPLQAIANELGVARNTVRNRLVKFGIARRAWGEHLKGKPKSDEERRKYSDARKRYWDAHPDRSSFRLKLSASKHKHHLTASGYRRTFTLDQGRIREHILVVETKLGRKLLPDEQVHHKDENKLNNHPDNLEVLTNSEHQKLHFPSRPRDPKTKRFLKYT